MRLEGMRKTLGEKAGGVKGGQRKRKIKGPPTKTFGPP